MVIESVPFVDDRGVEWNEYCCQYRFDGALQCLDIWAKSDEDAEARVAALGCLELLGKKGGEVTCDDSLGEEVGQALLKKITETADFLSASCSELQGFLVEIDLQRRGLAAPERGVSSCQIDAEPAPALSSGAQ